MGKINAKLKVILDKAQVEQAETRVFFERIKKKKPRDLDAKIHDLHQKTFKKIYTRPINSVKSSETKMIL